MNVKTKEAVRCGDCKHWDGRDQHWKPARATCRRIHNGGGRDNDKTARLYPVGGTAYLETEPLFGCALGEKA